MIDVLFTPHMNKEGPLKGLSKNVVLKRLMVNTLFDQKVPKLVIVPSLLFL